MSSLLKPRTHIIEIVDLAVIYNPYIASFIRYGLLSSMEVNDTEASHGQAGLLILIVTLIIRTSMADGIVHPLQKRSLYRNIGFK
jgi:hypothetical protein